MYIDESLSKGLRTAFWQFLETENCKLDARLDAFLAKSLALNSQKASAKTFATLDKFAASPTLLHREITGSKRRAVWWAINLNCDPHHEFDSWDEKALRFDIYRLWAGTGLWQPTWMTTLIGEHCIARMFQRLKWESIPQPHDLLPELREVALLINWYNIANDLIVRNHNGLRLSLFIPTSNGAFLGVVNPKDNGLNELRTFVGLHQLTENQRKLWDSLHAVSKNPLLRTHLGHTLDPSGLDHGRTAEIWLDPIIEIVKQLLDNAHLLQNEIMQLHPSLCIKIVE